MKIMLDSGAHSVWSKGVSIDLDAYIEFCKQREDIVYYVNLDVIPTKEISVAQSAQASWNNYKRMIVKLPLEKVMPVFHEGEDFKWLHKYLNGKAACVGLGGMRNRWLPAGRIGGTSGWIDRVKKVLIHNGKRIVDVHGFAAASWELMGAFPWSSVDSTTWTRHSHVWHILVPKGLKGKYDYGSTPITVELSPRGKIEQRKGGFFAGADNVYDPMSWLSPSLKRHVMRYLSDNRVPIGKYDVKVCAEKAKGDYWLDNNKDRVVRTIEDGVTTNVHLRNKINARVYQNAAKHFSIRDFYFSGLSEVSDWIGELECVLLTFAGVPKGFKEYLKWE